MKLAPLVALLVCLLTKAAAAQPAPDDFLQAVRTLKPNPNDASHLHALHVAQDLWITTLHGWVTLDAKLVSADGQADGPACRLLRFDQAHDLALARCQGTERDPVLPLTPGQTPVPGSHRKLYRAPPFLAEVIPAELGPAAQPSDLPADCPPSADALLFRDPPTAGQSGMPIIARDGMGQVVMVGIVSGGNASVGVVIPARFIHSLVNAGQGAADLAPTALPLPSQTFYGCSAMAAGVPPLAQVCREAVAASVTPGGPPFALIQARCANHLPEQELLDLQAKALARQAVLEDALGPAAWVLTIDAAFQSKLFAGRWLQGRSAKLRETLSRFQGNRFASAFEQQVFMAAGGELASWAQANAASAPQSILADIRPERQALCGRWLQRRELNAERFFLCIGDKPVLQTPPWMQCAVETGLQQLGWRPAGSVSFAACLAADAARWPTLIRDAWRRADMQAPFPAQSVEQLTWTQVGASPRLQVALWLVLHEARSLDLDTAMSRLLDAPPGSFPAQIAQFRKTLTALKLARPQVQEPSDALLALLPSNTQGSVAGFIAHNLTRMPALQGPRGLSTEYFDALTRLERQLCGSGARCSLPAGGATRPLADIQAGIRAWLQSVGLADDVEADIPNEDWLVLRPKPDRGPGPAFAARWTDLDRQVSRTIHVGLHRLVLEAFVAARGGRGPGVTVLVQNPCADKMAYLNDNKSLFIADLPSCRVAMVVGSIPLATTTPKIEKGSSHNTEVISTSCVNLSDLIINTLNGQSNKDGLGTVNASFEDPTLVNYEVGLTALPNHIAIPWLQFDGMVSIGADLAARQVRITLLITLVRTSMSVKRPAPTEAQVPVATTFPWLRDYVKGKLLDPLKAALQKCP